MKTVKLRLSSILTISIVVIGLTITLLVAYTQNEIMETYDTNLPYISLGDNIKNKTTRAHLWFEEYISGDTSIDIDRDVMQYFNTSLETLESALEGGDTELGYFEAASNLKINKIINQSLRQLEALKSLAKRRYMNKLEKDRLSQNESNIQNTGEEIGGTLDQEFDATYEGLQKSLGDLVDYVNYHVEDEVSRIKTLSVIVVIVLVAIFLVLAVVTYFVQKKVEDITTTNQQELKKEVNRINKMTTFVEQISKRNFSAELDLPLEEDVLANTLTEMKENLYASEEERKRVSWTTTGLAKFSEILRAENADVNKLSDIILCELIDYLDINQGAIYSLVENEADEGDFLEMLACYAYDERHFFNQKIKLGYGLLGQAVLNKKTKILTEVPSDYINITSGLGTALPSCVIIVPLKINEHVYGVVELASFRKLQEFEMKFIEKLSESIASTLQTTKVNSRTKELLIQTQSQAQALQAAEEELRMNMEEMQATQEKMASKERMYLKEIEDLKAGLDNNGHVAI